MFLLINMFMKQYIPKKNIIIKNYKYFKLFQKKINNNKYGLKYKLINLINSYT